MGYSPFIGSRIIRKTIEESDIGLGIDSIMNPHTCSCISCFLCRIIVGSIIWWGCKIFRKLIRSGLDLLKKENIRIIFLYEILDFSFFLDRTDAVYIPGYDAHIILRLQILRDSVAYLYLDQECLRHDKRTAGELSLREIH